MVKRYTSRNVLEPKTKTPKPRVLWRDTLTSQERFELERAERTSKLRPVGAGPNNFLPKLARMLDEMEALINGRE